MTPPPLKKKIQEGTRGHWGNGGRPQGAPLCPSESAGGLADRPSRPFALTLMHCDTAAMPVAVDQRVLGPAPLVGAHAAAADHLLHAIGELALQ